MRIIDYSVEEFLRKNHNEWRNIRSIYEEVSKINTQITNILQVHIIITRLKRENKITIKYLDYVNEKTGRKEKMVRWRG